MKTKPNNTCPQCSAPLPPDAPSGLCPACVMAMNLATPTMINEDGSATRVKFAAPELEEIVPLFPQLEIIELLGQGGMGVVYKARQKELDRIVALKILPKEIGETAGFAERFAREARVLGKLNHPSIVTLHEFGHVDMEDGEPLYYFLMEYVDGLNLRRLLNNSRVEAREALSIVPQICDALQYAHDEGIVHRDIKPENILLDRRGNVKVADFGLAKIVDEKFVVPPLGGSEAKQESRLKAELQTPAELHTLPGKVMGTPKYMSPEQVEAPGAVDHRADIYALGVVFYQMLTGEMPEKSLRPPSTKVNIDVRLDEVVLRALEQKPDLRYQQASILKTEVETIVSSGARIQEPEVSEPKDTTQKGSSKPQAVLFTIISSIWIWIALNSLVGGKPASRIIINLIAALGFGVMAYRSWPQNKKRSGSASQPRKKYRMGYVGNAVISCIWFFTGTIQVHMCLDKGEWSPLDIIVAILNACLSVFYGVTSIHLYRKELPKTEKEGMSPQAVWGLIWAAWALLGMSQILDATMRDVQPAIRMIILVWLATVITAPVGTTLLGWISIIQIRYSEGKVRGLGMAVFDGLLFPLLALDSLIVYSLKLLAETSTLDINASLIIAVSIGIAAVVDALIIHRIWRAVKRSPSAKAGLTNDEGCSPQGSVSQFERAQRLIGARAVIMSIIGYVFSSGLYPVYLQIAVMGWAFIGMLLVVWKALVARNAQTKGLAALNPAHRMGLIHASGVLAAGLYLAFNNEGLPREVNLILAGLIMAGMLVNLMKMVEGLEADKKSRRKNLALAGTSGLILIALAFWAERPRPHDERALWAESADGRYSAMGHTWHAMRIFGKDETFFRFVVQWQGALVNKQWKVPVPFDKLAPSDMLLSMDDISFGKQGRIVWSADCKRVSFRINDIQVFAYNVEDGRYSFEAGPVQEDTPRAPLEEKEGMGAESSISDLLGAVQERSLSRDGANDEGYIGIDFESGCLFTPSVPLMEQLDLEQLKFRSRREAERIPELMTWVDATGVDLLFHLEAEGWSRMPLHKLVSGRSPYYKKNIQHVTAADLTFYEAEQNGEKIFYTSSWIKIPYGLASEIGREGCHGFVTADGAKGVFEQSTQADPNLMKIRYRLITETTASALEERARLIDTFHVERNEVDVEIVAVTRNPRVEHPQWWKPDGTPITNCTWRIKHLNQPITHDSAALKVDPEQEVVVYYRDDLEDARGERAGVRWSPSYVNLQLNNGRMAHLQHEDPGELIRTVEHFSLKNPQDRINAEFVAIMDDARWEAVAMFDGEITKDLVGEKVLFSPPRYEKSNKRHFIDVMHSLPRDDYKLRLRARFKNGKEREVNFHPGVTRGIPTKGYAYIYDSDFSVKEVEEYVLERTPWLKTVFKNIALRPAALTADGMRELERAQEHLNLVEQQFDAGMVASDQLTEAQYEVDIMKASMEDDPAKVAGLRLELAEKQLAHTEACFEAGLIGPVEVEEAKQRVLRRTKELEAVGAGNRRG